MANVALLAKSVQAAGNGYTVPGAQEIVIRSLKASINGASAAGSFVPAVQLISPGGDEVGTFPLGQTLAMGASADVAWFPRGGVSSSTGGSGIQFDTDPQTGDWLFIQTTGTNVSTGNSLDIYGPSNSFIIIEGSGEVDLGGPEGSETWTGDWTNDVGGIANINGNSMILDATTTISIDGVTSTSIQQQPSHPLGFFGTAPVVQQAAPVTLADVIALLQAYGLAA